MIIMSIVVNNINNNWHNKKQLSCCNKIQRTFKIWQTHLNHTIFYGTYWLYYIIVVIIVNIQKSIINK